MDKERYKKHKAYGKLRKYFEVYGDDLEVAYPLIGSVRATPAVARILRETLPHASVII